MDPLVNMPDPLVNMPGTGKKNINCMPSQSMAAIMLQVNEFMFPEIQ